MSKPTKRIFVFSDGTGNSAAKLAKTNVWRLYEMLEKNSMQDPKQIAIYDNGVGTSALRPMMLLGGVFGVGLKSNVLQLYEFICRHYEPGAEIYLIGFSRGAFTMRLLAALIGKMGILKVGTEKGQVRLEDLSHYSKLAYQKLVSEFKVRGAVWITAFRHIRSLYTAIKSKGLKLTPFEEVERYPSYSDWMKIPEQDRNDDPAKVKFMGLFDTVSAYGGPVKELTTAFSWLFWPSTPSDWNVGQHVEKICHALALDEPRDSMSPKLISETKEADWPKSGLAPDIETGDRIEQVWFSGAHSNVGGGYANDSLSFVPLNWMATKMANLQVKLNPGKRGDYNAVRSLSAPLNDPRQGLGGVYRYQPRDILRLTEDRVDRVYIETPKLHRSVLDRVAANPEYAPIGITKACDVVDDEGTILSQSKDAAHTYYHRLPKFDPPKTVMDGGREKRVVWPPNKVGNAVIESAWDSVWAKRIVYFVSLFSVLFLAFTPLWHWMGWLKPHEENLCNGLLCVAKEPLVWLSGFIPFIGGYIQSIIIDHPIWVTAWLLLWVVLLWISQSLTTKINTRLIDYWQSIIGGPVEPVSQPFSRIRGFRTHTLYRAGFKAMKRLLMPFLWGLALVVGLVVVTNQFMMYVGDHTVERISMCGSPQAVKVEPGRLNLKNLCNDTQSNVTKGEKYVLTVIPEQCELLPEDDKRYPWRDAGKRARPAGMLSSDYTTVFSLLAKPLSRHPTRPVFAPVVQIGKTFPAWPKLDGPIVRTEVDRVAGTHRKISQFTFTANHSGPAYFYVNDNLIGATRLGRHLFYNNNCGTGEVSIRWVKS